MIYKKLLRKYFIKYFTVIYIKKFKMMDKQIMTFSFQNPKNKKLELLRRCE